MENKIELIKFDKNFYESLEEKDKIVLGETENYQTIIHLGRKIGIVGFIPTKKNKEEGFIQIILEKDSRGQGLGERAENLLAKKYGLKKLYATIDKKNLASIKFHKKSGFKILPAKDMENLRSKGLLKENQIRMVKIF